MNILADLEGTEYHRMENLNMRFDDVDVSELLIDKGIYRGCAVKGAETQYLRVSPMARMRYVQRFFVRLLKDAKSCIDIHAHFR